MLEDDIDKPDWISRHCEGTPHLEQDVMYSAVVKIHLLNWVEIQCNSVRKVTGAKFIVNSPVLYTKHYATWFVTD